MQTYQELDKLFGGIDGVMHSDVFGKWEGEGPDHKRLDAGMVVAQGEHETKVLCPIFKDIVPYKSVTVVCKPEQVNGVLHQLMNAHGGPHAFEEELPDGRIAIRSDYQAW